MKKPPKIPGLFTLKGKAIGRVVKKSGYLCLETLHELKVPEHFLDDIAGKSAFNSFLAGRSFLYQVGNQCGFCDPARYREHLAKKKAKP